MFFGNAGIGVLCTGIGVFYPLPSTLYPLPSTTTLYNLLRKKTWVLAVVCVVWLARAADDEGAEQSNDQNAIPRKKGWSAENTEYTDHAVATKRFYCSTNEPTCSV